MKLKLTKEVVIIGFTAAICLLLVGAYTNSVLVYFFGNPSPLSRPRPRSEVKFSDGQIALFAAAFGVVAFLVSAATLNIVKKLWFMLRAEKVVGAVIANVMTYNPVYYFPEFGFTTAKGEYRTFRSKTGSKPARYQIGHKITIYYDAARPEKAKVAAFVDLWLMPIIALVFAAVIMFFTVSFLNTFLYYHKSR